MHVDPSSRTATWQLIQQQDYHVAASGSQHSGHRVDTVGQLEGC